MCFALLCVNIKEGRFAMRTILWTSILLAIGVAGPAAHADERAYLIVFASQRDNPKLPRFAHTFVTFVHVDTARGKGQFEVQTISWLPQSMKVAPRVRPEAGKNLDLPQTLK